MTVPLVAPVVAPAALPEVVPEATLPVIAPALAPALVPALAPVPAPDIDTSAGPLLLPQAAEKQARETIAIDVAPGIRVTTGLRLRQ